MLRILAQVLLNGLGVVLAAKLIPGVSYSGGLVYLLIVGLVIGLINLLVKPLATLLSLPFIVLTLGLFYLVVNGAMFYLAGAVLDGLTIDGCMPAILGGLVLALFNWVVRAFTSD
ncbi:MAG: phage holin family protein [Thermoanaerobaculia bacterium]